MRPAIEGVTIVQARFRAAVEASGEVHLSDHPAPIAAVGQRLREELVMPSQGYAVRPDPVVERVLSGYQARSGRRTDRALDIAVLKEHPFLGNGIHGRCLDVPIPITAKGIVALLVGANEEDVGSARYRHARSFLKQHPRPLQGGLPEPPA